jgi:cytidine deaminase
MSQPSDSPSRPGTIDWPGLIAAAQAVIAHAYAPYSKFRVGAALLTEGGRLVTGCNVENASYGLTCCAERNAVFAAVALGETRFRALCIATETDAPVAPCGACRQVLAEFSPVFEVRSYGTGPQSLQHTSATLLPHAFGPHDLTRP